MMAVFCYFHILYIFDKPLANHLTRVVLSLQWKGIGIGGFCDTFTTKEQVLSLCKFRPLRAKGAVFLCIMAVIFAGCSLSRKANLDLDGEVLSLALDSRKLPLNIEEKIPNDTITSYYKFSGTKASVVDFFTALTNSKPVALAILDNAAKHGVPAGLAFAIAYEESRFNPNARNLNQSSVDRGLFQLNSGTFPNMSEQQAFDPAFNAKEGVNYFKRILEATGNEVSALAMYNAGKTRVSQKGAPVTTLEYISRILNYEKNIDRLFTARVVARNAMLGSIRMGLYAKNSD